MLLGLILCPLFSLACDPREAQFIGKAVNVRQTIDEKGAKTCSFQVDHFTHFSASYVCPLVVGEAISLIITDAGCLVKAGDEVSGVLIHFNDGRVMLE